MNKAGPVSPGHTVWVTSLNPLQEREKQCETHASSGDSIAAQVFLAAP